ncbi:MAG TPA: AAA domain-containing protein [Longimicrobiaceae bacterium]|jgi:hypothetical protein|nr:AAA domain-containing protein [Longimicrobiaceae bacterium]
MSEIPTPAVLRTGIRAALTDEREQDRSSNQRRALDRPAHVRSAAPQPQEGTTLLHLERAVQLVRGDEVLVTGPGGPRAATVRSIQGHTLEVDGLHAGAEQLLGRPLHLSERLQRELDTALAAPGEVLRAAAGWDSARLGRAAAPAAALTDGLEDDQADSLQRSLASSLLLVLGPPGTGKTGTMARTAAALLLSGERVLLLAPTHAAVDTALARIRGTVGECGLPEAVLLRQGRHGPLWRGPSLQGAHRTGLDAALGELERRAGHLGRERNWAWILADAIGGGGSAGHRERRERLERLERLDRLEARAQGVLREDPDRLDARALLRDARSLRQAAAAAAAPPRLVGATLAEALVRTPAGPWDTVIVDEAAMASVPYALWAASLARRRLLLWGDPHQLGPVCTVADPAARRLLGRSLFHHLGCERASVEDPRRPVLRVQHRMAPAIRRLVAGTFYDGMLEDGATVRRQTGTVQVIDSGGLARARAVGSSRVNEVHARMAAARAERLWNAGTRSLAVLTPYRAQVDCLRAALAERIPGFEQEGGLVGTAHSAQGSEHDAVVVDLVATRDSPGRWLDERANPEAPSLLCVAMSRARTSLTVIADRAALPPGGVAQRAVAAAMRAAA